MNLAMYSHLAIQNFAISMIRKSDWSNDCRY